MNSKSTATLLEWQPQSIAAYLAAAFKPTRLSKAAYMIIGQPTPFTALRCVNDST